MQCPSPSLLPSVAKEFCSLSGPCSAPFQVVDGVLGDLGSGGGGGHDLIPPLAIRALEFTSASVPTY